MFTRLKGGFAALGIALAMAMGSGCTTNPISGRSQLLLVSEESAIADSAQAYQGLVGQLEKKGQISHDEKLNLRISRITDRLIDQAVQFRPETAEWSWSIRVIEDPKTANAFCMPGGKMALYTGLIEKIHPTDDELAQVIGHEIAHALLKHGAEKMSVQMATGVAVAVVAVSGETPSQRQSREQLAALGVLAAITLPNSRGAESEADRVGLALAARAGYHPHAAVTLWVKMMEESGQTSRFDFLSTHPSPPKRVDALSALEQEVMPLYEEAHRHGTHQASRRWTALSPNEREIEADHGAREVTAPGQLRQNLRKH